MKKKNKNGFFLSETMVVMTIVCVVLLIVFKIFSNVYIKFRESEKYNSVTAVNAVTSIMNYYDSIGFDDIALLNGSNYIELTEYELYNSDYYSALKQEYNVDNIYLIDLSKIFTSDDINSFNISLRKYVKMFSSKDYNLLVVQVNGNEYSSKNVLNGKTTVQLTGNSEDEYGVYVNIGGSFIDPGYINWDGPPPTLTWEKELDTSKVGTYYLIYNFDGYMLRRKIKVVDIKYEYRYMSGYQKFTAPITGYYQIELWGASGGNATNGGKGAYTKGLVYLEEDEELYIYVGGEGPSNATVTNIGGYNGGGYSGNNSGANSYGGGGATDVRLVSGAWNNATGLNSRIMVAAGGAGTTSNLTTKAGSGGGLIGGSGTSSNSTYNNSTYLPTGATQTGVGFAYQTTTRQGSFGYGIQSNPSGWGGGGGGGYYGGNTGHGTTGSGGSSYISGHTGSVAITSSESVTPRTGTNGASCETGTTDNLCSIHYSGKSFINTLMIDGAGYAWTNEKASQVGTNLMPNPGGGTYSSGEGHTGNGYAKITFVSN